MKSPNPIELTGGQWVTRPGGLRVWQPFRDRTSDDEAVRLTLGILRSIIAGPAFCDCGCWLINQQETCPACLAQAQTGAA